MPPTVAQCLAEDARLYHQLRFRRPPRWWSMIWLWLTSSGLFVLAVQRINSSFIQGRGNHGWTSTVICQRLVLALAQPLCVLLAKADVVAATRFAPGVYLSDEGFHVVGAEQVGQGTMIHHCVTIGMSLMNRGKPRIGANVWIGPNTVIAGSIDIGDGATVLPNTVLTKSIPARCVVSGNPARIIRLDFENAAFRSSLEWNVSAESLPPV